MTAIAARLATERPEDRELGVGLVGLRDEIAGPFKPALVMLTAAVLGVLAITTVLGRSSSSSFSIEGRPEIIEQPLTIDIITPDFFQVLHVPLLRGRFFSHLDRADGPLVAIIRSCLFPPATKHPVLRG